jgi:hypothetical protein
MSKHPTNTPINVELSDKHSHKGNSFNNTQYRPWICCLRWLRKILLFYKKVVDGCIIYAVFLKYTK